MKKALVATFDKTRALTSKKSVVAQYIKILILT